MASDIRIVGCAACGTEGRLYSQTGRHDQYGNAMLAEEPCPYCEGTGGEIVTVLPIELEDFEAAYGN